MYYILKSKRFFEYHIVDGVIEYGIIYGTVLYKKEPWNDTGWRVPEYPLQDRHHIQIWSIQSKYKHFANLLKNNPELIIL